MSNLSRSPEQARAANRWSSSSRRARRRGRLLAAVASEDARRAELAEPVPDHIFLHEHAQELVPVVDLERVAHELQNDRAGHRPRLDGLLRPVLVQLRDLFVELFVYIRSLFCAAAHLLSISTIRRSPS